jgi:UDP-N-acetylglucosamine--N-acetylmuramyl-(pentapeptide) pyrophosphoryl-undecaprenol N-acetylglucosamine transferase
VSRAGASFVAELAAVGLPAVLVPLPGAPGDHQTANARVLTDAGAGVLVPDEVCSAERLGQALEGMLGDPGRLAAMEEAAAGAGRPEAAAAVAALVERWALPRPSTPVPEMGLVGDG